MTKELMDYTLKSCIKHCRDNHCELVLTSHFPLAEEYVSQPLINSEIYGSEIDIVTREAHKSHLYDYLVKDILIKKEDVDGIEFTNYVVGKLPYSLESIIKQLILSMEVCGGKNIVFFEHDCSYPANYIPVVERALNDFGRTISYCLYNVCYLNFDGYFYMEEVPGLFLLSCAGKKSVLLEVYKNKLNLFDSKKNKTFEPMLSCHSPLMKQTYPEEIVVDNSLCIDKFLGEGHSILNIKSKLNADGYIRGSKYFHEHPYWGSDVKYLNMLKRISEDKGMLDKWSYGLTKFSNY